MEAKSIKGKSPEEIRSELKQSMEDGFKPTLALVFMSVPEEKEKISNLLDKNGIAIFGATTEVQFTEHEIEAEGIVILLLDINTSFFKIVLQDNKNSSPEISARETGAIGLNTFSNPAFIISVSNLKTSGEKIIKGLVDSVGEKATIIGGFAGNTENYEGHVFTNKASSDYGLLTLILDQDKVDVKGEAISGWKPLGTDKTITKCEGPWIYTIDHLPAMEVVRKYIGSDIIEEKISDTILRLNTTYPLQLNRNGGSPHIVATLEFNTENSAVLLSSSVTQGSTFRFSLPPDFEVIDTVVESSRKIKENELPEADALVVFSCIARYLSLGPMISDEIEGLYKTWEKPTVGFFSLGEFGKVKGGKIPEFHGSTCCWVALNEKKAK